MAWAAGFSGATRARAISALGRIGLRNGGRIVRSHGDAEDPRMLPEPGLPHDPTLLAAATERRSDLPLIPVDDVVPQDLADLFTLRAKQLGVDVTDKVKKRKGDRTLRAAAGIASTGSVVLVGDDTARRPLLAAARVVVELSTVDSRAIPLRRRPVSRRRQRAHPHRRQPHRRYREADRPWHPRRGRDGHRPRRLSADATILPHDQ